MFSKSASRSQVEYADFPGPLFLLTQEGDMPYVIGVLRNITESYRNGGVRTGTSGSLRGGAKFAAPVVLHLRRKGCSLKISSFGNGDR